MSEQHKEIFLKDYTPSEFLIDQTRLDVDLHEEATIVTASLSMKRNPLSKSTTKQLELVGDDLVLKQVKINDKVLEPTQYIVTPNLLQINDVPDQFNLEVITQIKPHENTALSGLYKSDAMYCTQCEAEGFRRITYYLDRPDVMSTFIVKIHADKDKYPVLLSNGNLIEHGEDSSTRHFATWEDPFKKPCYLFAMVAGDLVGVEDHFLTMSGRLVTLKVYVERQNLAQTGHAMAALRKAMAWDEKTYGREYDLDIYMIVAANDFNMGAMENKGLNIFNSKYVLVNPETATDYDYQGVDIVIGHEYFHNWSGNRVTCRDWFQLSLKEGFTVFREQQFTQDIAQSPVSRIRQVKKLMTSQFSEDAGPLAHPVQPASYMEINNFYTMTIYEKGAEVIRMLRLVVGPEKYRAGTDLYFSRFDGQAATISDFVGVMQEVSGIDLTQFKLWYNQAGTPEISVQEEYDPGQQIYTLKLAQTIPDTPGQTNKKPMHIPIAIGLLDPTGREYPIEQTMLLLTEAEQNFQFKNITAKPLLSILRDFSAPVKLKRIVSKEDLALLAARDSDNFNRWFAFQQLQLQVLIDLVQDVQKDVELKLSPLLLESFTNILLNPNLNLELKAELITLPSTQLLIDAMQPADPDAIYLAKKFLVNSLTKELRKEFYQLYAEYSLAGPYRYEAEDVAKRTCRNTILAYIASSKTPEAVKLAFEQFNHANNMTDTIAALANLASIDCNERIEALLNFYDRWVKNPLVLNKWLSIQAMADSDNTLAQVEDLTKHEAFDFKNPNCVYALIGGFASGNPVRFHVATGAGYKFLADVVIRLNSINPQIAARIITPLTQWQKFAADRQKLMCRELLRIKQTDSLSVDVLEIVTKALDSHV